MLTRRNFLTTVAAGSAALATRLPAWAATETTQSRVRSANSGPWSSPATWQGGKLPAAGASVEVAPGHTVVYDLVADHPLRMVHVLGTLDFSRGRDTRLDVGLLKIGGDVAEDGAACMAHDHEGM